MIQAFVSLKPQTPPRTESGMRSFFEALQGAVFSQPTVFRTNADSSVRPYSLDAVCEAALNPRCKFVAIRAEREKFWQCTFLLPDKQGMGALFFDLQRQQNPRRLSPDTLIEMFKKLYNALTPRLIRVGDSEARDKLCSRHGLINMPGLGKLEWMQIVSQEVYGDTYNTSELVASPGYATEIWPDNALFLRVYDDPNDWDSEDNVSQANFVPGFLAGVAKIHDADKERLTINELNRLWGRAEKTALKAYKALDEDPNNIRSEEAPQREEYVEEDFEPETVSTPLDDDDTRKRTVVYNRLKAEYKVDENNIVRYSEEGSCTLFRVKAEKKPVFFASYQDLDRKVFILSDFEDLSRFLATNGCSVKPEHCEKIKELVGKYYRPDYVLLNTLDDLPSTVVRDRRMPEIRKQFKPASVETVNGNQVLVLWFYKPEFCGLETLSFTQFEDWPMHLESHVECSDMENEPEVIEVPKPEPVKVETPDVEPDFEEEEKDSDLADNGTDDADTDADIAESNGDEVPESESSATKIILLLIVILVVAYVACAYALGNEGFDWMFFQHLQ